MSAGGEAYNSIDAFNQLNHWVAQLNAQAAGTGQIGYRADRVTFGGGVTNTDALKANQQRAVGEQSMYQSSYIDFSQGDISTSTSRYHLAIRGDGFFAVAKDLNAGTAVEWTRNGEFHPDAQGYYRTREGMYLLGADDVDPQGNVVRDPVAYARPFPPANVSEPFGPGAIGVTDTTFNGLIQTTFGPAVGGSAPANYLVDLGSIPLPATGNAPSGNFVTWVATAATVGQDGFGNVGWYKGDTSAGAFGDPNGNNTSLHYGQQNVASYASGLNSAQKLDVVFDWNGVDNGGSLDTDMKVNEPDGLVTVYTSKTNNGLLNRDDHTGNTYNGPTATSYNLWDEWYTVNLTARASGAAPVAEGLYTASVVFNNVNNLTYNFVEDVGSIHQRVVASGTGNFIIGNTIASANMANRRNAGSIFSPEFALDPTFTNVDVQFNSNYSLDTTVSGLNDERNAAVDTMNWAYRLNGGGWVNQTITKAALNSGGWANVLKSIATGGATQISLRWDFDTADGKYNQARGWNIDNLRINQTGATSPFIKVDVTDFPAGTLPAGCTLCLWDGTAESTHTTFTTGSYSNIPYGGSWPIVAAELRLYDPAGVLIGSQPYVNLKSGASIDVTAAVRRGVLPAVFKDVGNRIENSAVGPTYYKSKIVNDPPIWDPWKTAANPNGESLVRNALELANTSIQNVAPELAYAQRMYTMLGKMVSARKGNFDLLAGLIH